MKAGGAATAKLSPQLLLTARRSPARELELFSPARGSKKALLHLLCHPSVIQELKFDKNNASPWSTTCTAATVPSATSSSPCRAAWRQKSGRKEGLKCDNGTFTYPGVSALAPLPAGSGSLTPSPVHPSPASTRCRSCRDRQPGCADWASCSSYCPSYSVRALADRQLVKVTWPQYLGALAASRTPNPAESPNSIKPKIVPSSRTTLRSHQNTAPASS